MSLPSYLSKIKSSGIYRFVWDKSEIAGVDAEVLRLVVGYSEKGPFNTPVYVKSESEFVSIFGDISRKLEKRGIFFHRLAKQVLAAGPILVLNLKNFTTEEVDVFATKVSSDSDDLTNEIKASIEQIYDTTRFWKLEPEQLADINSDYMVMSATDSVETSASVFIRGAYTTGYDVTISDWYNQLGEELPEYLENYANLLVSDFLAEVYVFNGKFSAANITADPLNKYFNANGTLKDYITNAFGEKVDTLAALSTEVASGFINNYIGVMLPDFKGMNGAYISLDKVFNSDYQKHKLMMNFNSDKLEAGEIAVDTLMTTGWTYSKLFSFTPDQDYKYVGTYDGEEWSYTIAEGTEMYGAPKYITYSLLNGDDDVAVAFNASVEFATSIVANVKTNRITNNKIYLSDKVEYDNQPFGAKVQFADSLTALDITFTPADATSTLTSISAFAYSVNDTALSATFVSASEPNTLHGEFTTSVTGVIGIELFCSTPGDYTLGINGVTTALTVSKSDAGTKDAITALPKEKWEKVGFEVGDRFRVTANAVTTLAICTGVTDNGDGTLSLGLIEACGANSGEVITAITDNELIKCNNSCGVTCKNLSAIYMEGYTIANPKPASPSMWDKLKWQQYILETLSKYQGLRIGLTNRTYIDFRYIVDTFEAFVENECHAPLALLCKEKDNALGLLNFPAIKTFKNCDYASFTDENGKFQTKYIAEGANKLKNPSILFSLASEVNGASFVSYNTPLVFTDSASASVKINVPSAALVSNNFMQKYLSRQPYYIVAGPNYGRMIYSNLVGPDFNFARTDLDILEPMGVNCMVYVPRIGTYINSNQTAKQNPVTALSKINIRELVIYLQDEIEKLLQDYQWEFNTPELRATIKEKADSICERVQANGGIYTFINVCDEYNNTDEVINNEMIVLSTSIEPGMGCGKMVQELTIYKKGGIQSLIK